MTSLVGQATAALLTPAGRGAVATIELRGDPGLLDGSPPLFQAANGVPIRAQALERIVFGRWGVSATEEVVVCRVGSERMQVHCHGGDAAVRRILDDLSGVGAKIETKGKCDVWTEDRLESECLDVLTRTTTTRTADVVLQQADGALRRAIEEILALVEKGENWPTLVIERSLATSRWTEFGRHLTEPWRIVLAGRPNVGKSSLMNALVGYRRSIVFDEPGTTRDVVTAETAFEGWPLRFSDTAGIRASADPIESAGIALTHAETAAADLVVLLLDVGEAPTDADAHLLASLPQALIVAHKSDLPDRWGDRMPTNATRVSSHSEVGIDELLRSVVRRLIPSVPPPGTAIPLTTCHEAGLRAARIAAEAGNPEECRRALRSLLERT